MGFGPTGEVARRPRATAGVWGRTSPLQCFIHVPLTRRFQMIRLRLWALFALDRRGWERPSCLPDPPRKRTGSAGDSRSQVTRAA